MEDATQRNTVFGFELDTPFRLRTGRHGEGTPIRVSTDDDLPAAVGEPLLTWNPDPTNPLRATLLREPGGGYLLDIADAGRYLIRPRDGLIVIPPDSPDPLREIRLLGLPLLLCFLEQGDMSLHAAAVEGPKGAVLIAAPGRHGKTSLAATFAKLGHRVLTEDLCRIHSGRQMTLVPGPATLRIRPDMSELLPVPDMVEIGHLDERTVLASTAPGDCEPVPIAAILMLKDFGNELSIEPVEASMALPDLWFLSLHLPSESDRARKFGQLVELVEGVPLWNVVQPRDVDHIAQTARALMEVVE